MNKNEKTQARGGGEQRSAIERFRSKLGDSLHCERRP